jgi:maltose alpha-D-glucosyltransferase/alpha-amylase
MLLPPPAVQEAIGGVYQEQVSLMGKRTAEMHLALASLPQDPVFAPEPYSSFDRRSQYQSLRNLVGRVLRTLRSRLPQLPAASAELARNVLAHETQILTRFEPLLHQKIDALRIRCHGDYHLEQVLWTGKDFVIIDFDGGHDTAITERRRKRSPLRDVASMIRSFHYAAYTALLEGVVRDEDRDAAEPWAHVWQAWIAASFFRGYRAAAGDAVFLPRQEQQLRMLVDRSVLATAFHELGRELQMPGERVSIPLHAIMQMMGWSHLDSGGPYVP